jgi:HlyD family secretion protein
MHGFTTLDPRARRRLVWIGGVVLVIVLLAWFFHPTSVPVEIGIVDAGPLQSTVEGEGKTRVRERYIVSATIAGRLSRVDWMENDKVRAGQVVARIDPLPLLSAIAEDQAKIGELESQRAGVNTLRPKSQTIAAARAQSAAANADERSAESAFAEARAELAQAIRDRDRAHMLYHGGGISLAEMQRADLDVTTHENQVAAASLNAKAADARAAQAAQAVGEVVAKVSDPDYLIGVYDAQIAATQADLAKLKADEIRTVLYSPVDGRVLRVDQKSEQYVAAGSPVIEIGNPQSLELVIELLSTDAINVRPGADMSIDDGSGTWRYRGRVRYVEPAAFTKISTLGVEEQRVNVVGDFTGPHAGFGDAFRVDARIVTWQSSDVRRVPSAALFRCGSDWCVFVVQNGQAREQHVQVDHIGDVAAQVLGGLNSETQVILRPTDKIANGTRVSPLPSSNP